MLVTRSRTSNASNKILGGEMYNLCWYSCQLRPLCTFKTEAFWLPAERYHQVHRGKVTTHRQCFCLVWELPYLMGITSTHTDPTTQLAWACCLQTCTESCFSTWLLCHFTFLTLVFWKLFMEKDLLLSAIFHHVRQVSINPAPWTKCIGVLKPELRRMSGEW